MQWKRLRKKLFRKLKRLIICKESILAMKRSPARRRRVRPALKQQLPSLTKHKQSRLRIQLLTLKREMKQPSSAVNAKRSCLRNVRG
jgi:hypothetical protein